MRPKSMMQGHKQQGVTLSLDRRVIPDPRAALSFHLSFRTNGRCRYHPSNNAISLVEHKIHHTNTLKRFDLTEYRQHFWISSSSCILLLSPWLFFLSLFDVFIVMCPVCCLKGNFLLRISCLYQNKLISIVSQCTALLKHIIL